MAIKKKDAPCRWRGRQVSFPARDRPATSAELSEGPAFLHRENSYFYKTWNGGRVGDLSMSLIQYSSVWFSEVMGNGCIDRFDSVS